MDLVTEVLSQGRSSLWRGAWIETAPLLSGILPAEVAPLYGEGRGLKPRSYLMTRSFPAVAPLYGEGRGLKHRSGVWRSTAKGSLLSMERGVD